MSKGKIVLVAETGCDLTAEEAGKFGVYLVPMHVSMGNETRADGSFPPGGGLRLLRQDRQGTEDQRGLAVRLRVRL